MLLPACDADTVESKFSKLRASFSLSPVNTIAPLNQAMTSKGAIFCTITFDTRNMLYVFRTLTNSQTQQVTAEAAYKAIRCIGGTGGGFIVGEAELPDLGTSSTPYLCYDLCCPNCWRDDNIAKNMKLEEGGRASCSRCHRAYDLSNEGLIVSGEKGRKLERYRMSYNSMAIMIAN